MVRVLYYIWCFLVLLPLFGTAQQFNFKTYSVGDGLAQSQVYTILEDSRGYLWMGTRGGGLSRFDGIGFTTFTVADGLIDNYIICLYEDDEQNLWIGTNTGISRYDGNDFENITLKKGDYEVAISCIMQDKAGMYWLGTSYGVYRFDGKDFHHFSEKRNFFKSHISCIHEDQQGTLWVGSDKGLSKVGKDTIITYTTSDGLNNRRVRSLTEDKAGHLWIGTYGGGVNVYDGTSFKIIGEDYGLVDGVINSVTADSNGEIWLAMQDDGVCRWNPIDSSFTYLKEVDGLSNNHARTVLEDSWGNHWFGTSGGGVSKYFGQQFVHYNERSGLSGRYVYSVFKDSKNRLWMGASGRGVSMYNDTSFTHFNADNGFLNIKVKEIAEDHRGRLWFGTEGNGIGIYDGHHFNILSRKDGLSGNWIRDVLADRKGYMWVATAGGGINKVRVIDTLGTTRFQCKVIRQKQGLAKDRVNALSLDKWGRIWYATDGRGIGYIENDSIIVNFDHTHGLSNNNVRSIVEDAFGNLWVGSAGGAINRAYIYEDTIRFDRFDHTDGLRSTNVYLLQFDQQHNLWVGSESGVDLMLLDMERNVVEVKHYGKSEGFVGIETCQNASCIDREGNLWFGTINGLTQYNPNNNVKNVLAPKTNITNISLFYEPLTSTNYNGWIGPWGVVKPGLVLPHNQNHLSFDFIGINHKNPEKVTYQWMLEGSEETWRPPTSKSDATYSNLPHGEFTFKVRSANEDGIWSEPVTVSFTITPPWWKTWWFLTGSIGLGILLIVLVFMARVRRVKRKVKEEQERLTLEKDLIQLEQKALRLQMNPHFIFNALNSIQGSITENDHKTARYQLAKFSKLMRAILENSRESLITLEDEVNTLEYYLALEKFSSDNQFDYTFHIDPNIDQEEPLIPPMMIQPFVENAIIHGMKHLHKKGHIEVAFQRHGKRLVCEITDNGIGREKAGNIKSQQDQRHKSTALIVTQERLDILNQNGSTEKSLEIIDLINNGTPSGTKVVLRIPIE